MKHVAVIIPNEYFVRPMLPHTKQVLQLCNAILDCLRQPPSYEYLADGRHLFQYTTKNTVHYDVLQVHLMVDTATFNDALAYLQADEHITIQDNVLHILPQGLKYSIDGGYDYGQNTPMPEIEFILKDGIYIPKPLKDVPTIRYKNLLTPENKTILKRFLEKYSLVNEPDKFVAFLNGENDGDGLELNPQEDALTAVTLLLQALRQRNLLQLSTGNDFKQYFASRIRPFSIYQGKEQIDRFKAEMRKSTNKKWMECPIAKDLEKTIEAFLTAGFTVFVICL